MEHTTIKFENMPAAVAFLIKQVAELHRKFDAMSEAPTGKEEQWMDIHQLSAYLPTHPAKQTIYGWTSTHQIPFYKKGKRIMFLKSDIDRWLISEQLKSIDDITADAEAFCNRKSL